VRLLLIRHAETTANVDRLLDTAPPGADLSDRGREQADALVDGLDDVELDAIYVSDLVRTQQTAAPLAGARSLEPRIRPGVREIQAGDYEMAGCVAGVAVDVPDGHAEHLGRAQPGERHQPGDGPVPVAAQAADQGGDLRPVQVEDTTAWRRGSSGRIASIWAVCSTLETRSAWAVGRARSSAMSGRHSGLAWAPRGSSVKSGLPKGPAEVWSAPSPQFARISSLLLHTCQRYCRRSET